MPTQSREMKQHSVHRQLQGFDFYGIATTASAQDTLLTSTVNVEHSTHAAPNICSFASKTKKRLCNNCTHEVLLQASWLLLAILHQLVLNSCRQNRPAVFTAPDWCQIYERTPAQTKPTARSSPQTAASKQQLVYKA